LQKSFEVHDTSASSNGKAKELSFRWLASSGLEALSWDLCSALYEVVQSLGPMFYGRWRYGKVPNWMHITLQASFLLFFRK
jgi:hypothetical protein